MISRYDLCRQLNTLDGNVLRSLLLSEETSLDAMHSWPSANGSLLPVSVAEVFTSRVLQPGDPAAGRIALEHEGPIGMADNDISKPVASDVHATYGYGRVKFANLVLGPCYARKT
jgi:hypothetical protein